VAVKRASQLNGVVPLLACKGYRAVMLAVVATETLVPVDYAASFVLPWIRKGGGGVQGIRCTT
jgi:hypothetical protein